MSFMRVPSFYRFTPEGRQVRAVYRERDMDIYKSMQLAMLLGWREVEVCAESNGDSYLIGIGPEREGIRAVPDYFGDVTKAVELMVRFGINVGFEADNIYAYCDYPDGTQTYTEADRGLGTRTDSELTAFCISTIALDVLKYQGQST